MDFLKIKERELKQITLFLIDTKVIFHPSISPKGFPNFSNHKGRKNVLILDRNILTPMISLLKNGHLKDEHILKIISSLMFWALINNFSVTSGLALSEYAHHKGGDNEANVEKDLFLKSFDHYDPDIWLNLALGRLKSIEPLSADASEKFTYNKEFDHYKMHYLEMLKIAQLFFEQSQSIEDKFKNFYQWVYENVLIGKYTNSYLSHLFSRRINTFNNIKTFDQVIERCKNQAWDLSYLSLWSTLYYKESETNTNYLFATLDRGMKDIFISTYDESTDLHSSLFGSEIGNKINQLMLDTFKPRKKPNISIDRIDEMINEELEKLRELIQRTLPTVDKQSGLQADTD